MAKYVCSVCGFIYDEAAGIPELGIVPGTKWEDLPDDWVCPLCGAEKSEFEKRGGEEAAVKPSAAASKTVIEDTDMKEMSALELSALCSNLARGCEKQYKHDESELFKELADYFKKAAPIAKDPKFEGLIELIEADLGEGFPHAHAVASEFGDRGALRALVWSEKVTKILRSLVNRYQKEGDKMLENTEVYVCTICGFVFVGDNPPELCPVCKVPNWKFEKVGGRK